MDKFLTEPEVAERLRCSTSKVKRLRLSGCLAYVPGRPVLISESDLSAYIETTRRKAQEREAAVANASKAQTRGDTDAKRWALNATVLRHRAPPRRGLK